MLSQFCWNFSLSGIGRGLLPFPISYSFEPTRGALDAKAVDDDSLFTTPLTDRHLTTPRQPVQSGLPYLRSFALARYTPARNATLEVLTQN